MGSAVFRFFFDILNAFYSIQRNQFEPWTDEIVDAQNDFYNGAVRNKRREETILIQSVSKEKLKQHGVSCISKCFDISNAFYSIQRNQFDGDAQNAFFTKLPWISS